MMNNGTDRKSWTFEVQAWHIVLLLAVQLVVLGIAYGRIIQTQEDTRKDIARIEAQRAITKDEFDEWKMELLDRINRLEVKLDERIIKDNLSSR